MGVMEPGAYPDEVHPAASASVLVAPALSPPRFRHVRYAFEPRALSVSY